ncbi:putative carbon storage regulator [Paenibacillus sp. 598K]|nr:putative carbon storage regulator [Paenibacillus sp. 598K]
MSIWTMLRYKKESAIKNLLGKGMNIMLVIGRKPGQTIIINEKIIIKVIKSDEGHLRLAIDAPKDVPIIRGELLES